MEPEFHDGQIAWVLQQESVANGEIGIFALNGEAYIKKLQNDKDGIFLISLNEKYAPIKVGENDRLDTLFCIIENKKISIELKEGIFMAVTNNIREIREQRGIYQDDLAAAIGYSTKTVGRIERGDSTPSAEFMLRISKYFNMLVEDVFHVEDWAGYFIQLNLPLPVNENLSAPLYKIIPFFRTTNYFSYLNDIDYLINYIIFCLKYP